MKRALRLHRPGADDRNRRNRDVPLSRSDRALWTLLDALTCVAAIYLAPLACEGGRKRNAPNAGQRVPRLRAGRVRLASASRTASPASWIWVRNRRPSCVPSRCSKACRIAACSA